MSKAELTAYLLPLLLPLAGGIAASLLEALGTRFKIPALVAFSQRAEGLFVDLPKVWRGSRKTAADKDSAPPTPRTGEVQ